MQKNYFHNDKISNEERDKKKTFLPSSIIQNRNVDINKLLNRVKVEKKKETKEKIIFYSSDILALSLMGTFIATFK